MKTREKTKKGEKTDCLRFILQDRRSFEKKEKDF